ncbi:hypothetical protein KBA41_10180 [Candidatus Ozemobacteraceae bacterium]|nr:hypothetical protein [Candidatus Ozemobacteraceae bacterium]
MDPGAVAFIRPACASTSQIEKREAARPTALPLTAILELGQAEKNRSWGEKLIGVISQVESLHDRLPAGIDVTRLGGGHSPLEGSDCTRHTV